MLSARRFVGMPIFYSFCAQLTFAGGPPFKFATEDGNQSVTFGFLAQPQFESLENATGTDSANNLFFRRLGFIAGGKLTSKLSYFVESDAANLGKKAPNGDKINDWYLQDAFGTFAF